MTTNIREFIESPLYQGTGEKIRYNLTTTQWGSSPSSPVVKIYNESDTDTSTTNLDGTASAAGDVVTTPFVKSLLPGVRYKIEIQFTSGGNIFVVYGYIRGEA